MEMEMMPAKRSSDDAGFDDLAPATKRVANPQPVDDELSDDASETYGLENEVDDEDEEEEGMTGEQDSSVMGEFVAKVKRMCELEDKIKEMNSERKVLADEKNALREDVMTFMASKNVGDVNYKDQVLFLDTREQPQSLTRKSLLGAIKEYYSVGTVNVTREEATDLDTETKQSLDEAEEMYKFVNDFIGQQTKVVLVRESREKKRRPRKAAAPLSVYSSKTAKK